MTRTSGNKLIDWNLEIALLFRDNNVAENPLIYEQNILHGFCSCCSRCKANDDNDDNDNDFRVRRKGSRKEVRTK
jgi:hypothetical protein